MLQFLLQHGAQPKAFMLQFLLQHRVQHKPQQFEKLPF
jgi:hypothetical protein